MTSSAGSTGMLQSLVTAVKQSLDHLPGYPRTQIGFITFDTTIHFYSLKSSFKAPQMLVVSDISDVIMPSPEDLVVNLQVSVHLQYDYSFFFFSYLFLGQSRSC